MTAFEVRIAKISIGCALAVLTACDPAPATEDGGSPVAADGAQPPPRRDAAPTPRPDAGPPPPGACGLPSAAFCERFDGPSSGVRTGELDGSLWSASRVMPQLPTTREGAFVQEPAVVPDGCRSELTGSLRSPDEDLLVCDPTSAWSSPHLLVMATPQNYGLTSLRIRQPFDFAGRTGTIAFNLEDGGWNALYGWAAVSVTGDPTATPSTGPAYLENGVGPRDGFTVHVSSAHCAPGQSSVELRRFGDFVEHDVAHGCFASARGRFNHFELRVSSSRVEVWVSPPASDGASFGPLTQVVGADLDVGFERGYVNLVAHNHASRKYGYGSALMVRWDDVAFDGPVLPAREGSVPDRMREHPSHLAEGCTQAGPCEWLGSRDGAACRSRCGGEECLCYVETLGVSTGYLLPASAPGVSLRASLGGVEGARAVLTATTWSLAYDTMSGVRYRLNGGPWHSRSLDAAEVAAATLSGAHGMHNLVIEVDPAELVAGENTIDLHAEGLPQGGYPPAIANVDLVMIP